jgi:hypothetical protein
MIKSINNVLIWTNDYKKLAQWYSENLGFDTVTEYNHPNDTGVLLKSGPVGLWIGQHSEVKGPNQDIHRHMVDFLVDSVTECYEKLKLKKIKLYGVPTQDPTSDKYVLTLYDLDNNLIQLVGKK